MDKTDPTLQRIAQLAAEFSDNVTDAGDIRPETKLVDDLQLSSLMAINLIMELETAFDIIINEEDFTDIQTVADLMKIVDLKRAVALT